MALTTDQEDAVKSLLLEKLLSLVGEETNGYLADYIVMMIKNEKSMEEIQSALGDMIPENTASDFTTWYVCLTFFLILTFLIGWIQN